jgi:hypothetical protein
MEAGAGVPLQMIPSAARIGICGASLVVEKSCRQDRLNWSYLLIGLTGLTAGHAAEKRSNGTITTAPRRTSGTGFDCRMQGRELVR